MQHKTDIRKFIQRSIWLKEYHMPNGFFETYFALSACMIAFCLLTKVLNKTNVLHVVVLSFLGTIYMTPLLNNLFPSLFPSILVFSSQAYNFLFDMLCVAVVSCLYIFLFRRKLAKRKRDILYLALLTVAMMPLIFGAFLVIVVPLLSPEK